ncbi:cellulose synthase/poly-beta-1,6-N-acetylglucosamine synthase-like glycosyltransferase [Algoriphagus boseongensis]|uniref:Cellulose synthase/poly-beta-1,6-N-acetylglucosamine synthase-like glycosyltransferase n=1 Tax=Algoriphagus boseongensis TaxID=1442587 RepID=A0A4R6T211_9BACT|nr:glycosyltransferase [Algoriphagus boseongensis]TDQ15022.1 cellulose synthase/poly-beta-1,6-N-acetylglucosamine synthase-like glycosyltransferase [Algoriphagus boseongensis]
MISFYLLWCIGYFILLALLSQKWPKDHLTFPFRPLSKKVSLIIPFRNEQENALPLLKELKKMEQENLEILLVDDQSEDDSFQIFLENSKGFSSLRLLRSPGIGKKAALDFGIKNAQGDLILTSDADCFFPDNWVENMVSAFDDIHVQLVAGPVISDKKEFSFSLSFQQIEWASILLLTNFSFQNQAPLMCSGANLAFRKIAFLEVEGYQGNEHLLSGDDEFLLKKIFSRFGPDSCKYLPSSAVLVNTSAQDTWAGLINQRVRWAGKWKVHHSFSHGFASLLAFGIQIIWLSSFYFLFHNPKFWLMMLVLWGAKVQAEKMALGKVLDSLEVPRSNFDFILTSIIHPFYVIRVGIGAILGKFSWKGRSN